MKHSSIRPRRQYAVLLLVVLTPCCLLAEAVDFEWAKPAEIGLSEAKLENITRFLQQEVERGHIAGAVAAVARHGRLGYLQAVGQQDIATGKAMQRDSIFRIASMTKAVTSASVMSLVEDGRLALSDPLSKYLPEFATMKVLADVAGESTATVVAEREPTLHDLLTHRSGLTYGWFGPEKLDSIYRKHSIPDLFVPIDQSLAEKVMQISHVPLKFQPGSSWDYGVSTDVLGRVVEVVSGLTLDQFFRERFFRPLRMRDTHFSLPSDQQSRLAGLYTLDDSQQLYAVTNSPVTRGFLKFSGDYCLDNHFYSGGGGLVSTTTDYLRFLQMLLNGGTLDGVRVLKSESVALMTQNQIGEMHLPFPSHGDGFGFGFGVVTDRGAAEDDASVGSFSWGGIFNTYFWVDPQEDLIGVLMTQVFPYDHLNTRARFKQLAYAAIDDSGFHRVYWYTPGEEHANPHFNRRQLRVNAPEASIHPEFALRSEPRSSGLARVLVEEDLRKVRRADLITELWGGHPGTAGKRISVNGRSLHPIPEVGTARHHCTHQYPTFNLRPQDLVNGHNSLQFACDQGESFWGHYIVDNAAIKIGLRSDDPRLTSGDLTDFHATVVAKPKQDGEGFSMQIKTTPEHMVQIAAVHYQGRYFGYDENGNRLQTDWHGMTKDRAPYGIIGTSETAPFIVQWDTSMLTAQENVELRATVEFKNSPKIAYTTPTLRGLTIAERPNERVAIYSAVNLPTPFWSRAGQFRECAFDLDVDPRDIIAAELYVVAWTGGAGNVAEYFTLNGKHFPIAEGTRHETIYSRLPVDKKLLRRGRNQVALRSDTTHHGIEILAPGPALMIRHRKQGNVRLSSTKDESAGGLDCYKIETPKATYYLDKIGAGLSSMIDRDGNDWISFHPQQGSGAAGEYRGFPNAVFKSAGSYFHPRNAGTDPCVIIVEEETPGRVVISALAGNGKWAGRYTFTADTCTFTLTQKPSEHNYWVLYEGTPGGQYDDTDWWMSAATGEKTPLTTPHEGDLAKSEWIAFGDKNLNRMLVLHHAEDDEHPDRYYQMQKKMTVFGFGREGMKKFLDSVPQTFSIGFVESTSLEGAVEHVSKVRQVLSGHQISDDGKQSLKPDTGLRAALEQFALTTSGDVAKGRQLFHDDQRTKCLTCHRIDKNGGKVGPDLSKIGGKFDRPHLIESLLRPSQQIVEGYRTTLIVTDDGTSHSGIVKSRDDEVVTLVDGENQAHSILKSRIDEQIEATVSLMPTGLADALAPQEFSDLIAYLETLRTGKPKFGSGVTGPIELPAGFQVSTIATGLSGVTALEVAPDGRVFVCEQHGTLWVIKDDNLLDAPFLTVPVEHYWERGLIGVTVSAEFPRDPYVYVVYVTNDPFTHHRVSRFRAEGDTAVPNSEEILLRGDDQSKFGGNVPAGHQGGAIHFGNDGKLYIGIGEQTAKTPAQRFDALQGKLLRINPDGSIPTDNPFLDRTTDKYRSIWAIGCRNPFTFAVQRSTGEIFINDVGGEYEEINRGLAGANYGWPAVEHGPTDRPGIVGPLHVYPQASISGGDFADASSDWPAEFRGRYFFADFVHGWIKTIDALSPLGAAEFAQGFRRPVDIRFANDGSLYVLLRNAWVVDDKFEGGTGALMRISYRGG